MPKISPDESASNRAESTNTTHLTALQDLIDVVAKLRSPDGGCPWDLEQTPETLMPYIIEEAYEAVDAIRQGDPEGIADELGDLLLQVVLQAQIASEAKQFTIKDVAEAITAKLIRRHPHVFGTVEVSSTTEVHANWERIKAAEERGENPEIVDDEMLNAQPSPTPLTPRLQKYARSLPPLMACHKISKKAASAGFEWDDVNGVWDKFHEELDEFHYAVEHESKARQQAELGDLLFTLVNIARWHGLDASEALQSTNQRFINRFAQVEEAAGRSLTDLSIDELENMWQTAKAKLATQEKQAEG
jgi:XTP/dITP diphosphohydrolase